MHLIVCSSSAYSESAGPRLFIRDQDSVSLWSLE